MNSTIFTSIVSLLMTTATPLAMMCFVMAGLQLRGEGGINYDANGGFFKWIVWGAILLTLSPIFSWLTAEGFTGLSGGLTAGSGTTYTNLISKAVADFVNNILVARFVPIVAGALVLKAVLDTAEGHSPLPSIIAALFLLGVGGFSTSMQGWNDGSTYATTNMLKSMLTWAMNTVAPVMGIMCVYGAILQYLRRQQWGSLVFSGMAFLAMPAIWTLVQGWMGVSV